MAVTANQIIKARNAGSRIEGLVVASKTLYAGTMAFSVAASGYITDDDASGANPFMGIVVEQVDNSSGSSGDKKVELYTEGEFVLTGSTLTQAMVGDKMYATDNYTIIETATNASKIGVCTGYVSATQLRVKIEVGDQTDAIE